MEQNTHFATPVAMRIETQEQAHEVNLIVKSIGFNTDTWWPNLRYAEVYIQDGEPTFFFNACAPFNIETIKIETYNPNLFRALAVMRSGGWGAGEMVHLPFGGDTVTGYIQHEDVAHVSPNLYVVSPKGGWWEISHKLTKLTAAEVIDHFTPAEKSQEEKEQLPERWAIERTKENADVINDWANKQDGYASEEAGYSQKSGYIHSEQVDAPRMLPRYKFGMLVEGFTPITFDQFKRLVLKEEGFQPSGYTVNGEAPKVCAPLTYGGDIADFPIEIVNAMLDEQERQGNKRDVTVFEKDRSGDWFYWCKSSEREVFWDRVIRDKDFAHFFARYPKATEQPAQEIAEPQPAAAKVERHSDVIPEEVKMQIPDSVRDLLRNKLEMATSVADNNRAMLDNANADLAAAHVRQKRVEKAYNESRTHLDELQSFIAQFPKL